MTRGYVRLWRKTIEDTVFQDPHLFKIFAWCLLRATYKTVSVPVVTGRGQTIVTLNPGQLIFGRHSAAHDLNMPPSSLRNRLEALKKLQILDIKADTHFSIITVMNWGSYQSDTTGAGQARGQAKDRQRTHTRSLEREKEKTLYGEFVLLTEDEYQKLLQLFGEQGARDRIEVLDNAIGSKGYRYKSHYHTILTWEKKNEKQQLHKPLGGLAY